MYRVTLYNKIGTGETIMHAIRAACHQSVKADVAGCYARAWGIHPNNATIMKWWSLHGPNGPVQFIGPIAAATEIWCNELNQIVGAIVYSDDDSSQFVAVVDDPTHRLAGMWGPFPNEQAAHGWMDKRGMAETYMVVPLKRPPTHTCVDVCWIVVPFGDDGLDGACDGMFTDAAVWNVDGHCRPYGADVHAWGECVGVEEIVDRAICGYNRLVCGCLFVGEDVKDDRYPPLFMDHVHSP